jgi:hypothetical protein
MGSSLLFRLPRELRDQIYEYALYEPQGIIYLTTEKGSGKFYRRTITRPRKHFINSLLRRSSHLTFVEGPHGVENNQLKYVCRRLYYETRMMDLRCNYIVFRDSPSSNAVQQSVMLFSRCSVLRRVNIMTTSESFFAEYGQDNLSALMGYCTSNPAIAVRLHIPYWSQANATFVLLGLSYLSTLRSDPSLMTQLARSTSVSYLCDSICELLSTTVTIPLNFRFFPREENFDLDVFQHGLRKSPLFGLPCTEAAIGDVRKLAERWFHSGL